VPKASARRFGAREVDKGKNKGSLHVAPPAYVAFVGEISYLEKYLNTRLMPQEPEDASMTRLLLALQNILEYEIELAIASFVKVNPAKKNRSFLAEIQTGFVSFKSKFTWARARKLITDDEHDIMEEVRLIRNAQTHARPSSRRPKYKYFGKSLLLRRSLIALFTDVNGIVLGLRKLSGNKERWEVIPPGLADEMGWNNPTTA
jgi:hypothetical protein